MAVRLSIVSSFDAKGIDKASRALKQFQNKYNTGDFQLSSNLVNFADFAIQMKRAGANIQTFGAKAQSLGTKLTKYITAPALGAATALGAIVLKKGWDRLESIDNAKKKLEGLGHSAESISAIMQSASDAVTGTAFGMGEAATVAASTVAAGVKEGEELTRVLTLIGDSATIAGTDFESMGAIWNKIAAKGKISGKEINQLTQQGIPVIQALAEEYGVTAEEISKMVSSGEVDFAHFSNAMEKYLGGAAQKSGETFRGAVKNIGAAIGRIGANILDGEGGGMFSALKPALEEVRQGLSSFEKTASKWGAVVGEAFSVIYERGKELVKVFLPSNFDLSPAADTAQKLKEKLNSAFDAIIAVAKVVKGALDLIPTPIKTALIVAGPLLVMVGKFTSAIGGLVVKLGSGLGKIANWAAKLQSVTKAGSLLNNMTQKLTPAMSALGAGVAAMAGLVIAGVAKMISRMTTLNKAINGFKPASDILNQAAGTIGQSMTTASGYIGTFSANIDDVIAKQAELVDTINTKYTEAGESIGKLTFYQGIIEQFGNAGHLTAGQQAELAAAVDYVNRNTDAGIEITNSATGALNQEVDAINETIEAKKRQIEADAALSVYEDVINQHIRNATEYKRLDREQTALLQEAEQMYISGNMTGYQDVMDKANDLAAAKRDLSEADMALGDQMNDALSLYAQVSGATGDMEGAVDDLGFACYDTAGEFSSMASTADSASRDAAKKVVANLDEADTEKSGYHLLQNFANGMYDGSSLATRAASAVMDAVAERMQFSVPEKGVWSGTERGGFTSGRHLVENFKAGMEAASTQLAQTANAALSFNPQPYGYTTNQTTNVYIDGSLLSNERVADAVGNFMLELQALGVMNG